MIDIEESAQRSEPNVATDWVPVGPAGFLSRALAFGLDLVLVHFLYLFLIVAGMMGIYMGTTGHYAADPTILFAITTPFVMVWPALFVGYFTYFHVTTGQTPGKAVLRIQVVTQTGRRLSTSQAVIRVFCYGLSGFFFGLGFLIALVRKDGKALHDLLVGSQVVLA